VTFDKGLFKPLTAKETSILQSLADGLGTKEIAEMHGTSPQTIKNFVYRSCQKTGCDNRVHLVAQAIRRGIVR
jgi:DNA-binding CsgD family transcriptional regulator